MLVTNSKLIGTTILSVQAGGPIASITSPIIDPDNLKIIAFELEGPAAPKNGANILDVSSIREYSNLGMVVDDADEFVTADDVIKISDVLALNFNLIDLKVKTRKGTKLGHIQDFTVNPVDFIIQQIIVKRPPVKAFLDPELTISRREIIEVTDYEVVVKDEEKVLKQRAEKEGFVPNFVNPFREKQPGFAPADIKQSKS